MAETWDEDKPAGSRSPTLGDDDIREFKRAVRERLAEDHEFEATESPAFGATDYKIGKHNFVTLSQRDTSKTTLSDEVSFVCKAVSGNPEVLLTPPSAGTDRQLTKNSGANLNLNSGDFASGIIPSGSFASEAINASTASSDIAGFGVRTAQLDTGAVTSGKIADYAVGSSQLNTGAVDSDNYADNSVDMKKLTPGLVMIHGDYEERSTTSQSYTSLWASKFLCPNDPSSLRLYVEKKKAGTGTGYVRLNVGGQTGVTSFTNNTYAWALTAAVDISGLTPGTWYDISVQANVNDGGTTVYFRGFIIYQDA